MPTEFQYLTPDQQQAFAEGRLSRFKAAMLNNNQTPAKYGAGDFITPYLDATERSRASAEKLLADGRKPDPSLTPMLQGIKNTAFGVGQIAVNPWENAIKPLGQGAYNAGESIINASGMMPMLQNWGDAIMVSQGELARREKAKTDQERADAEEQLRRQQEMDAARIGAFDAATGENNQQNAMLLGPAIKSPQGSYTLPPPPGPTDFSSVQEAIDQTRPEWDEADFQKRRQGAIMTGLVGGLLQAAMNPEMDIGQILGAGGLGVLSGMSQADEKRNAAKEKFQSAMNEYWVRTAGVRQNQAESNSQYAQRVYDTKVAQMRINAEALQAQITANASKRSVHNTKDGLVYLIEETVQTPQGPMRQARQVQLGQIDKAASMQKNMEKLLGGTPEAKAKADAIIAETFARKDPAMALPLAAVTKLKTTGTYLDAVNFLAEQDPTLGEALSQDMTKAMVQGMDETTAAKYTSAKRDAIIVDMFMQSKPVRDFILQKTGMLQGSPNLGANYQNLLTQTGR